MQHFIKLHSVYKYAGMFHHIADMREALALVMRYHIKSEIIGHWLYCFTTPLIGFQLEAAGFFYSFKHRAYVYTGTEKETMSSGENLDEIRARLGSRQLTGGNYV